MTTGLLDSHEYAGNYCTVLGPGRSAAQRGLLSGVGHYAPLVDPFFTPTAQFPFLVARLPTT